MNLSPGGRRRRTLAAITALAFIVPSCAPTRQSATRRPAPPRAVEPEPDFKVDEPLENLVRIGIRVQVEKTTVAVPATVRVVNLESDEVEMWPAATYTVSAVANTLLVNGVRKGRKWRIENKNGLGFLVCNGLGYRGDIVVTAGDSTVTVINELEIDDYLKGVLPREVVVSWHAEALKVQAVASRTYLASHLNSHGKLGFDLCSDVHCQVYGGVQKENARTTEAVESTKGQILMYDGKPISAFFHSNCGGITEQIKPVWGADNRPYLPRKRCPYGTADPRYDWKQSFTKSDILAALKRKTRVQGNRLEYVRIKKKSPSGRAEIVGVATDADKYDLTGNEFRIALHPEKIRSTLLFSVTQKGDSYTFVGRGWGHGVGMCQWGAKGQAEKGKEYRDILAFYYPNSDLRIWNRW